MIAQSFLVSVIPHYQPFAYRPVSLRILSFLSATLSASPSLSSKVVRAHCQLLVITHQKRTMEIADALYGVTMRGDGVSAVISQRLRETESVA